MLLNKERWCAPTLRNASSSIKFSQRMDAMQREHSSGERQIHKSIVIRIEILCI